MDKEDAAPVKSKNKGVNNFLVVREINADCLCIYEFVCVYVCFYACLCVCVFDMEMLIPFLCQELKRKNEIQGQQAVSLA